MNSIGDHEAIAVDLPTQTLSKGEREYRAFLRLLPQLLEKHRDQFVAVHDEQVVDCDSDDVSLILRVQAKFGYVPIHVVLVTDVQAVARVPHYREIPTESET